MSKADQKFVPRDRRRHRAHGGCSPKGGKKGGVRPLARFARVMADNGIIIKDLAECDGSATRPCEPGDVVQLKSGGPKMTVVQVLGRVLNVAECVWMNERGLSREAVPLEVLIREPVAIVAEREPEAALQRSQPPDLDLGVEATPDHSVSTVDGQAGRVDQGLGVVGHQPHLDDGTRRDRHHHFAGLGTCGSNRPDLRGVGVDRLGNETSKGQEKG